MASHSPNGDPLRRTFLKSAGVLAVANSLAGCMGGDDSGDGGGDDGRTTTEPQEQGTTVQTSTPQGAESFTNKAGAEVGASFDDVKMLAEENEQQATIYSTVGLQEGMADVKQGFKERYPFAEVAIITGGSETLINRWTSEYRTENVVANVFFSGSKIKRTWQRGQVMKLRPEFMPTWSDVPDQFKDAENNNWVSVRQLMGSVFYNTDMVSEDAITDWMALVEDERWSGQNIGWDPTPNVPLMTWFLEEFGREFFEKLRAQKPRFVDSHTDLARFTGAGQYPVSFTYTQKMSTFGPKLPVSYFPLDPMPSTVAPAVISNLAPQPNTAILFLNFMNSEAGQGIIANHEMIPWRVEWKGYPGVFPSDQYDVQVVSPSVDLEPTRQMWSEVMGPLLGG